ncbi:hypothetical protein GPX89_13665 [Nocardia sp. ET3-3]|uniref:Uncharacterized protein n=1 Tax=Nocardia terrae TaxID=2675851 RepID=A0A7K1UWR3_9NOCA|nr:hypothetical protein [Nocardia terrae]MVU78288.1 hypothetical protein [Nocardia terrae]
MTGMRPVREILHTPDDMLVVWWEAVPTVRFEAEVMADLRRRSPAYLPWLAENPYLPDDVVAESGIRV